MSRLLTGPESTEALGAALAPILAGQGGLVTLAGDLGAGKTTLVRGLLHALGYKGAVKSPTYTLVEPYELDGMHVLHLDLYRLADAGDLEPLGVRDAVGTDTLLLVEWPERAGSALPVADLAIHLEHAGDARSVSAEAGSTLGTRCIQVIESIGNQS